MKNGINLLPQKTKKDLKQEKMTFGLDIIATIAIIIVELFTFSFILYSNGLHSKLIDAKSEYSKNISNLHKFSNVENLINNINQRYSYISTINRTFPNPINIISLLNKLVPSNISISNINYSSTGQLNFTCNASNVLDAAQFMYDFANYNPNNKYFTNTQIQSLSINQGSGNSNVQFIVSTQYNNG